MSDPRLRLKFPTRVLPHAAPLLLGKQLIRDGIVTLDMVNKALKIQQRVDMHLGEILIAQGALDESALLDALALQHNVQHVDLARDPPKERLARALPAALCIKHRVVPWMQIDETLLVAINRPDLFDRLCIDLEPYGVHVLPVISRATQINDQINRLYASELQARALTSVAPTESCRDLEHSSSLRMGGILFVVMCLLAAIFFSPAWTLTALILWCVLSLALTSSLKVAAFFAHLRSTDNNSAARVSPRKYPKVSIMVPLYKEPEIIAALIKRLEQLTYPKSLLEIILVLEEKDYLTRQAISASRLPYWIRLLEVPGDQNVTTKPRAMNYALDFCQGSIIGVWDAEDAPELDQIEKVVNHFASAGEDVACLQGVLDYYNPRENWLARCFTIEYATWWRLVMPGMARLGLVIPLGGTTLFFRRDILEEIGAWDAYNVTEDADLGVRLARYGYRTELLQTVTYEEANCRPWHWVRQRSRWLKGFLITWLVHTRNPRKMINDLGWKRAFGLQIIFFATFNQFATAPLLWSFLLITLGLGHPVMSTLGEGFVFALTLCFIVTELINLLLHTTAVMAPSRRHLLLWTLTMPVYFILGTFASYKALGEMFREPFYWDKTEHGVSNRRKV